MRGDTKVCSGAMLTKEQWNTSALQVWDLNTRTCVRTFTDHSDQVGAPNMEPRSPLARCQTGLIVVGVLEGSAGMGRKSSTESGCLSDQVWGVDYNSAGTKFISCGDDGSLVVASKTIQN